MLDKSEITPQSNLVQNQPAPLSVQPTNVSPSCPPGLEYLTQLDQVLIHQQVELFEG